MQNCIICIPIYVRIKLWRNKLDRSQAAGIDDIGQIDSIELYKYRVRVNTLYNLVIYYDPRMRAAEFALDDD